MGQRRHQNAKRIYRVWNHCFQGRRLLQPDPTTNAIIAELLSCWSEIHEVEIYTVLFLDDRFYLDIRCTEHQRAVFMRDFQRELAKAINRELDRSGSVFAGPYRDQALLDDQAVWDAQVELLCLPVELGLVTHPELWPGHSSLPRHADHRTSRRYSRPEPVDVEPTPVLAELDAVEAQDRLVAEVEARRQALRQERPVGCPKLSEHVEGKPRAKTDRSFDCQPRCRATDPEAAKRWMQRFERRCRRYRSAYRRWIDRKEAVFPAGTHRPSQYDVVPE